MKKYLQVLKGSSLFQGMTEEEVEKALGCLAPERKSYAKGAHIFTRGESITSVALVLEGRVHIQKEDYWGNLSILSEISEGEVFGEVYACLRNENMLNNAVAVKDSQILLINIQKILTVCSSACAFHSRLIQNLFTVMAFKNKMLAQKLEHMSQRTTREKLRSYLSEQSMKSGSSSFYIPFNRQQLADFLSVDRSAMSNELCKMREEGILTFDRNYFELK